MGMLGDGYIQLLLSVFTVLKTALEQVQQQGSSLC